MYIIIVNPSILSSTGMPFSGVLTATVLVSALASIAMGIFAKNPVLIAPGMGINAFFTYTVVAGMKVPWEVALGVVFWSGVIFFILSVCNVRTLILQAIPKQLRFGVAGGIGLFISIIGLKNAGFIVSSPDTLIARGSLTPVLITFIIGLAVTAILVAKNIRGALVIGIGATTLLAMPLGRIWGHTAPLVSWNGFFAMPDFSLFFKLDVTHSLAIGLWPALFAFLFTCMFDSLSTFVGVAEAGNLMDENGEPRNIRQSLIVDSLSTVFSGIAGTSPGTSYIESATGIAQGGRRGLTAIVAGLLFLPFMFFSPVLSVIPAIATAPALVLVGVFMMKPVLNINWNCYDDAIPAFLAFILIPLTSSITQGIVWGFLCWTVIKIACGKYKEVSPMLLVIDALAIVSFIE